MRRRFGNMGLVSLVLLCAGCGDLGEVAALGGVADGMRAALPHVSEDFHDSCTRRAALVERIPAAERPPGPGTLSPDCTASAAVARQLGADQAALVDYLQALSKLGSGAGFSYGGAIGADVTTVNSLSASSGANAVMAADAQKAGVAALTLTGKLADLALQHMRKKDVRRIVLEANPGVQALTAALYQAGDVDYGIALADEKGFLDAYYEGPIAAAGPGERLARVLVQRQYDGDTERLERRQTAAAEYGLVMQRVGVLHARLTEAARDSAGFEGRVKAMAPELNQLRDAVAKLQDEVR